MKNKIAVILLLVCFLVATGAGCKNSLEDKSVEASLIAPDNVLEVYGANGAASQRASATITQATIAPAIETKADTMEISIPSSTPVLTPTPSPETPPMPEATPEPTPSYVLTPVKNEKGHVKAHDVKLRDGPGTEYNELAVINYLTSLVITGKTDKWYQVEIDSLQGFMLKEYIGLGAEPTPTPKPKSTPKPTAKPTPKPESSSSSSSNEDIKQGSAGDYSEEDIYLAAKLIYAEGKNQSTESFLAMANVLYNRCNSSKFGGSVQKEVYRSGQFSVVKYSSFEGLEPSKAALSAAREVFNNGKRVLPTGVLYFRAARLGEYWASSRKFYKQIGGNNYYY